MTARGPDTYKRVRRRLPIEERFWAKVDKSGECWTWTGWTNRKGYGELSRGGRDEPHVIASRLSWEIHNGPIPNGLWVLHKCDNPPCVRPAHLYLGTPLQNTRDAWDRNRMPAGDQHWARRYPERWKAATAANQAINGTRHRLARFNDADLAVVRQRLARGDSRSAIGRDYGVHPGTISRIALGKTYPTHADTSVSINRQDP